MYVCAQSPQLRSIASTYSDSTVADPKARQR